jgi:hypothetical protein
MLAQSLVAAPLRTGFLLLLLACGNDMVTHDECLVNLAPIAARTKVVSVGDTVTFSASLGPAECLPPGVTGDNWRWASTDTLIAKIDSLSGLAEGKAPGIVSIQVQHADNASVTSTTGFRVLQ